MNEEAVVKILTEAREAVRKCIGMLELEQGFGPITGVYIANYKLLVSEIGDAIRYLEDEERTFICDMCEKDFSASTELYCKECAFTFTCAACGNKNLMCADCGNGDFE